MERNVMVIAILIALVLISIVQAVEIASVKNRISGNSVESVETSNGGDQSYDEMMAEMHPELAASKQTTSSSPGTMVGGC